MNPYSGLSSKLIVDELNKLLVKDSLDAVTSTVTEKEKALNGKQTKVIHP